MAEFNPDTAIKAQQDYCERNRMPHFAPYDGLCYRCGLNIYMPRNGSRGMISGFTAEQAGEKLITSCPHCNASYTE